MTKLDLLKRLEILADAAKYDASCASSGSVRRSSRGTGGIGSTGGAGICHSYAPDGRCISLLKILMTNACMFDCAYCINRSSSNVRRARFTVDEIVDLTMHFYRRNYIEGLFLSSGIVRSANHTMEQLGEVARKLRVEQRFSGYIHLKAIAEADPDVMARAGQFADRLSVNLELPSEQSLERLAPDKKLAPIKSSMAALALGIAQSREKRTGRHRAPLFVPAGQSTQMIVGADASRDADILSASTSFYASYALKRVYYSAFSPIPDASARLPLVRAPLLREHRLYQADWLLRFYGFSLPDIGAGMVGGMLDLAVDPKLAVALLRREDFPVDVNSAERERLLRIPGFGARSVDRLLATRRHHRLRYEDVARIVPSIRKARPFFVAHDWSPGSLTDHAGLRGMVAAKPEQLDLFG